MQANAAPTGDTDIAVNDLGPLAWVLDELRKSLEGATKALRRFVRDAELARGSDLAALDSSQLRIARQQLHQAVGALEMVGLSEPAKLLKAMEALAQKFVQRPELCSDDAANKVERASFALSEYLEGVLKGKVASSVALFPQYRDVLELIGAERVHPADLWPISWRWIDVVLLVSSQPLDYGQASRASLDRSILKVVQTGDAAAAATMRDISLGFAAAQTELEPSAFWKICAAYFEALALGLGPLDVHGKRAASRVLFQYRTLAKGEQAVSDRLAQDLLFFCAQARPTDVKKAPVLGAVRAAYGLSQSSPVNYESPQFGRYDPAVLVQARKRIAAATETWSALAGGDTNRFKVATDQFSLVADSILKLHPESGDLARAMVRAIEATVRSAEAPTPALAMEVATSVLYLDAAYDDIDPTDSHMLERSVRLAQRLDHVIAGGQPEPLEGWMEELYRRVSDRQTMGSVVAELRTTLGEVEKALDQFFRNPQDKLPLHEVPSQLAQMRGVFSVLGLDQASLAALRMRTSVEKFLVDDIDQQSARVGIFEKLGNSLGAIGFLIDMLSYQRALAKKLFVYDEDLGEFKPLMGREKTPEREAAAAAAAQPVDPPVVGLPAQKGPAVQEVPAMTASAATSVAPASAAPTAVMPSAGAEEDDEAELKDIFLEEAREVVGTGLEAISELFEEPSDLGQQTTLRRAFHTLKGSSRMVGLNEFGEAAWSMEQLLNTWLADQKPVSPELLALSGEAMRGFGRWVGDIAAGTDVQWSAASFREAADGLRLHRQVLPLLIPGAVAAQGGLAETLVTEGATAPDLHDATLTLEVAVAQPPVERIEHPEFASTQTVTLAAVSEFGPLESAHLGLDDIDFANVTPPTSGTEPIAPSPEMLAEIDLTHMDEADAWRAPVSVPDQTSGTSAVEPEPASVVETATPVALESAEVDDQVKVIGTLRINIPLYNVYLNEADEWSRRLLAELGEWEMELHRPVPDSAIGLAHSLSGSSATVGFSALSDIARALEQALQHLQLHGQGSPEHARVAVQSAEEIRRLLHQFAAGFLKEPDRGLLEALKTVLETEFVAASGDLQDSEMDSELPSAAVVEPDSEITWPGHLEPAAMDEAIAAAALASVDTEEPVAFAPEPAVDLGELPIPEAESAPLAPAAQVAPARAQVVEAASQVLLDEQEDEYDAVDALDADLFPIFEEEALELMPKLGGALRQWAARPDNLGARSEALRVLHTLKGSARLAGANRLGEMTHRMESVIEQLGIEFLQGAQIDPLLVRFDAIGSNFDALRAVPEQALSRPEDMPSERLEVIEALVEESLPITVGQAPVAPEPVATPAARPLTTTVAAMTAPLAPMRAASNQSVRVRSLLLDRLVNQAGEVMITRSRLEARLGQLRGSLGELSGNLDRLRHQLRDIELQSESQMQSRLAQAKDSAQGFDPLEFDRFTRVQELTRMMAESVHDVATVQRNLQRTIEGTEDDLIAQGRQARELQRDLLRTRMVEFEGISERLYGVVRQASKDSGKQVKLDIVGGSLDMDRGVLDRMAPAFEHLLRNAVAHGIEDAAVRERLGKPAAGTITINLNQQSNDVTVEFSDDGAGLDLPRIREKAFASGQIKDGEVLSDAELASLIFTPGFSTASQVTELSGRGIGMDVVRAEVNALGGRIETSSETGKGSRFKLILPLTTAVTQVVMLRVGDLVIGVPANLIEIVRRVPVAELERAYQADAFEYGGEQVPFFWAGALLQSSVQSNEARTKTLPVAIFRSAGQRLAAHMDEVLGNQEVVVKNLGPQLSRLPGLSGMSVLASGAVVLIYNPVALAAVYGEQARQLRAQAMRAAAISAAASGARGGDVTPSMALSAVNQVPLVLVVDDSITVRRVTQRLLKREGFRVAMAADGLQALERLQEEKPSVVLSDIEMPRMDGFDLARNIRGDAKLRDLPIIMITSRIAEKHREHARELGVNHYLGKPYSEDELIGLVRQYCVSAIDA
ncbi:Hpt domain-containing protein [Rhodoferax sp.]|uniref:hybrid sensor histidine kinase/response regulator n=1 Tax=Rhodoferax sp. TaxID=50421 RepID=UPI0027583B11|nr:Hpt domain-containing protein [Rhodoferax sp.]